MKTFLAILILILSNNRLSGQILSIKGIENDLHETYQKILYNRFGDKLSNDSIENYNHLFREKLIKYTSKYPQTFTHKFDILRKKDNIDIVNSEDSLLRIYSWNTWLGGTMYDFHNVFQYKSGTKIYSKVYYDTSDFANGNYIPFYSQIFLLRSKDITYYLLIYNGIYSSSDVSQSIKVVTIENNSINDSVKLIKTKEGLVNSISFEFDFFSVVDRPERPLKLIKYDNEKRLFIYLL